MKLLFIFFGVVFLSATISEASHYLLRKYSKNEYFCLNNEEKSDEDHSALYWTETLSNGTVRLITPEHPGSYFNVDFQRVPENVHGLEFQSSDWRQMSNIEIENQKFGFVFDHRWETLPMLTESNLVFNFSKEVVINQLGISLWSNDAAKIVIGESLQIKFDPINSFVDVRNMHISNISQEKTTRLEMPSGRWNHFLLELKYGQRERSLNISDGNIIEIGLMEESWKAKSITFEPDVKNPSFLKLHIYDMMVLTETTGESQTTFLHSENETCLLMTLFTKSINRKFSFKFGTGTFEFRDSSSWQQQAKCIPQRGTLILQGIGNGTSFLALAPPRLYANAFKWYGSSIKKNDKDSKISCHNVKSKTINTETEVGTMYFEKKADTMLKSTCNAFGKSSCEGQIFCEGNNCSCLSPFTGASCTEECAKDKLSNYDCGYICGQCETKCDGIKCSKCIKGFRKPGCTETLLQLGIAPKLEEFVSSTAYFSITDALNATSKQDLERIDYISLAYSTTPGRFATYTEFSNVTLADFNKTSALTALKNGTRYFIKASVYEKGESQNYNRVKELKMNFTFVQEEIIEPVSNISIVFTTLRPAATLRPADLSAKDEKSAPSHLIYTIVTVCICSLTIIIAIICYIRNRRAPDEKRTNFSVRYSRAFPGNAQGKKLDFEANQEEKYLNDYEVPDDLKTKSVLITEPNFTAVDDEESHIYEELPDNKKMDVLKFGKHVEKCMKKGLFKKMFAGIQSDVCIGIGNSEYFMPPAKFELDDSENALGKQFRPINFIEGYKSCKEYMLYQGPSLKQADDFWLTAWTENIRSIVLLEKCEMYWPKALGTSAEYDGITVEFSSLEELCDFSSKTFTLTHQGETRMLRQYEFKSWADCEFPTSHIPVPQFINKIYTNPKKTGPILMQYSNHIERLGMIMFVDICTKMTADLGKLDPDGVALKLLRQNQLLFDNHRQFSFANMVLLEYLTANSAIPCNKFDKVYKGTSEDRQFLKESFDDLNEQCKTDSACFELLNRGRITNNSLSIPRLNGYKSENQFLVVSKPKPLYMWALVVEHQVQQVVILNEQLEQFLPSKNEPMKFGNNEFQLIEKGETELFHSALVQINDSTKSDYMAPSKYINVLIFKGWPEGKTIGFAPESLITFWEKSEEQRNGPWSTLITCGDGVTGCGLYLSLGQVIEKMKWEQTVDIDLAIRMIRQQNPKFVQHIDQYKFMFDAVMAYKNINSEYANFN